MSKKGKRKGPQALWGAVDDLSDVEFTQGKIQRLDRNFLTKLVANYLSNSDDPTSAGYCFVKAMEEFWSIGVLVVAPDKQLSRDGMVAYIWGIIHGQELPTNIWEWEGSRYYVYTLAQFSREEVEPRDPLSEPSGPVHQRLFCAI